MGPINQLPHEILGNIFTKISDDWDIQAKSLCNVQLVCKKWQNIASSDLYWKPILQEFSPHRWEILEANARLSQISIQQTIAFVIENLKSTFMAPNEPKFHGGPDLELFYKQFYGYSSPVVPELKCKTLKDLAEINKDPTTFIENLLTIKPLESVAKAIVFLSQTGLVDHGRLFPTFFFTFRTEVKEAFAFTLSFLIKHKPNLSFFFTQNPKEISVLLTLIEIVDNRAILSLIEAGFNPNATISETPLLFLFLSYATGCKVSHETTPNILCTPKHCLPILKEQLISDFEKFLKLEGLDINIKNTKGKKALLWIQELKAEFLKKEASLKHPQRNPSYTELYAKIQLLIEFEKLLIENGATL